MPQLSEEELIRLHERVWSKEYPDLLIYVPEQRFFATHTYDESTSLMWSGRSQENIYGLFRIRRGLNPVRYFNGQDGYFYLYQADSIELAEVMGHTLTLLRTYPVDNY